MGSEYGDQSVWLRFDRDIVTQALVSAGKAVGSTERRPFRWAWSPCHPAVYLAHRKLVHFLISGGELDFTAIPETAYALLDAAIEAKPGGAPTPTDSSTVRKHRTLVRRCQEYLEIAYTVHITLDILARELATSPFHLSRAYRRHCGMSIHKYLVQLRLRAAMDRMLDAPDTRLTDLSMDIDFSTPSHFSSPFRKHFGLSPSQFPR